MANRRISPQVQQLFERYLSSEAPGRRLSKDDAVRMLVEELGVTEKRAVMIFDHFDKDGNGQMSLWEFQHLYNVAGARAAEIVELYEKTDEEDRGYITLPQTQEVLKTLTTSQGSNLDDKEIQMFSKTAGTNELVTFGDFIDLYARVKMYKKPPKKQ